MSRFLQELRKVPLVTRSLCGLSLAISLPVLCFLVRWDLYVFDRKSVTEKFEIWRVLTSFFIEYEQKSGIRYLFDLYMLYQTSDILESSYYARRRAVYVLQLLLVAATILLMNLPLKSWIHTHPFLIAMVYFSARLSPPGTGISLPGLFSVPLAYVPYGLIVADFVVQDSLAAASSVTGAVVGHLWWLAVRKTRKSPVLTKRSPAAVKIE